MTNALTTTNGLIVPVSRVNIDVRQATLADIPFFDRMQKQFGKQLGYFPTKQFEGYVEMGAVLVAEEVGSKQYAVGSESDPQLPTAGCLPPTPLGYVISRDRYLKRDELGVIYQLCVAPGTQRKLVGATLVAEVFRRSAYGCKLYCCWCAQDIEANFFWESLGFVPIAFRAGGKQKKNPSTGLRAGRVHIFWQRRINQEDVVTPWWYPSATNGGAIREDRLVFPIPPGVHWKDVTAVAMPEGRDSGSGTRDSGEENAIASVRTTRAERRKTKEGRAGEAATPRRVQFGPPSMQVIAPVDAKPKREKPKRVKTKNDPRLAAAARELRDRWMEQANANPAMLVGAGKYEVTRALPATSARDVERAKPMLPSLAA